MGKEFAWDEEVLLDEVMASDKVKFEVRKCKLNGTTYISTTKWILTKNGWSYPKNSTYPLEVFYQISDIINNAE